MQGGVRTFIGLPAGFAIGLVVLGGAAYTLVPASLWSHAAAKAQSVSPPSPASTVQQGDRRTLAYAVFQSVGMDKRLGEQTSSMRARMITLIVQMGVKEDQAAVIADRYMLPEFHRRAPELASRFESIIAEELTASELQALLKNEDTEARRSALSKVGNLTTRFSAAGREWGSKVGDDAYQKYRSEIDKLRTSSPGSAR